MNYGVGPVAVMIAAGALSLSSFSGGPVVFGAAALPEPPDPLSGWQPEAQAAGSIAVVLIGAGKGPRRQAIDAARRRRACGL